MDGLILINKQQSWTSRDVCNVVQKRFSTKKVGHTGTLDPFATGLLIITINKANKISQFLDDFPKTYVATLSLGKATDTLDLTGNVTITKEVESFKEEYIKNILDSFKGEIEQIPPMTSAIHYNGRKLYEYHYEGIEVKREARKVHIYNIKLIEYKDNEITFECEVSKGTYVRVLGEQIAEKLNTVGHLTKLNRTKIGNFEISDAIKIDELTNEYPLINISKALNFLPTYTVEDNMIKKVKDGVKLYLKDMSHDIIYINTKDDTPLAVYERSGDHFVCKRGLW